MEPAIAAVYRRGEADRIGMAAAPAGERARRRMRADGLVALGAEE